MKIVMIGVTIAITPSIIMYMIVMKIVMIGIKAIMVIFSQNMIISLFLSYSFIYSFLMIFLQV